jgi:hypothetical protein
MTLTAASIHIESKFSSTTSTTSGDMRNHKGKLSIDAPLPTVRKRGRSWSLGTDHSWSTGPSLSSYPSSDFTSDKKVMIDVVHPLSKRRRSLRRSAIRRHRSSKSASSSCSVATTISSSQHSSRRRSLYHEVPKRLTYKCMKIVML